MNYGYGNMDIYEEVKEEQEEEEDDEDDIET
jgi:hypothetical protein